jgi:hypothetical protein
MKTSGTFWLTAAGAAALLGGASLAHSQDGAPAHIARAHIGPLRDAPARIPLDGEQAVGGVSIGCTGVGQSKDDPRWKAYPIRVEASNPGGDLLADIVVRLSDNGGAVLATVRCAGPWVMLKAAPGDYKIEGWMPGSGAPHQVASVSPPTSGQKVVSLIFPQS